MFLRDVVPLVLISFLLPLKYCPPSSLRAYPPLYYIRRFYPLLSPNILLFHVLIFPPFLTLPAVFFFRVLMKSRNPSRFHASAPLNALYLLLTFPLLIRRLFAPKSLFPSPRNSFHGLRKLLFMRTSFPLLNFSLSLLPSFHFAHSTPLPKICVNILFINFSSLQPAFHPLETFRA